MFPWVRQAPGFDIDDVITDIRDGDDGFDDDSAETLSVCSSSSDATIQSSQPSFSDVHLANDGRQLLEPVRYKAMSIAYCFISVECVEKGLRKLSDFHFEYVSCVSIVNE